MLVTKNQFYVFIACIAFGAVSGLVFGGLAIFKIALKNKILRFLLDIVGGIIVGGLFVYYAFKMNFPTLRVYMFVGVLLGLIGYFKSFNILLAKSIEKIYNICKLKKVKKRNDRIKVQKTNRRRNRRRGYINDNIDIRDGVSVSINRCSK